MLCLPRLSSKQEVDDAILNTEDLVLVLRFGRESDSSCLELDNILYKTHESIRTFAKVYTVEVDSVPVYVRYFDISLIPSTVFFFNGEHIKVDWSAPDHTKFVGTFKSKQDFIDSVETVFRAALKGKYMISCPIDPQRVPKYTLIYNDI